MKGKQLTKSTGIGARANEESLGQRSKTWENEMHAPEEPS